MTRVYKPNGRPIHRFKKTHGLTNTRTYSIWRAMLKRCYQKSHPAQKRYSERGITVCKEWFEFENFFRDMGHPTTDRHTLDRVDNNMGYSKENCRWATYKENNSNRSDTVFLEFRNLRKSVTQWAEYLGVNKASLAYRIANGWPVEEALTKSFSARHRGFKDEMVLPAEIRVSF